MSFAISILENVLKVARERNAKIVTKIKMRVGELLLINPEQLEFCFKAISKDTIAENASLELEIAKADIKCIECGKEFPSPYTICDCGGKVSIEGGKEFILESIEMEVENAQNRN